MKLPASEYFQQFLCEAIVLTSIGGVVGTMCIGLFFGVGPALKAARLDPIEALRYE